MNLWLDKSVTHIMTRNTLLLGAVLLLTACGGGGGGSSSGGGTGTPPPPPPPNTPPTASAGADQTLDITQAGYALDGTASSDADGDALSYSWSVASMPDGASASFDDAAIGRPTLVAQAPGAYEIDLTVTDPAGASATDRVVLTLNNQAPVVTFTADSGSPVVGRGFAIDASASSDPNGHMLSYSYRIESAPDDSGMSGEVASEALSEITFDTAGAYTLSLDVSDGYETTTVALGTYEVDAVVFLPLAAPLDSPVFNEALGKMASLDGSDVVLTDITDGAQSRITLPLPATSLSVSPDGTIAAVGHNARLSLIDLSDNSVIRTVSVPMDIDIVVMGDDGNAHAFPDGRGFGSAYSVNAQSGAVTEGAFVYETWGAMVMHPSGNKMYGANQAVSPDDVLRIDIGGDGVVERITDSRYHGDYSICGGAWMGPRGSSLLTTCGVIMRLSDDPGTDMTFALDLPLSVVDAAASDFDRSWSIIPADDPTEIRRFDADQGGLIDTVSLDFGDGAWTASAVFGSDLGEDLYIVGEKDGEHMLMHRISRAARADDFAPTAAAPRFHTGRVGAEVTLDGSASTDPEGLPLTYEWMLVSEPEGSNLGLSTMTGETVSFTPRRAGTYSFSLRVSNGTRQSGVRTIDVNAFPSSADLVHRIEGGLADVEYSAALNSVVLVGDDAAELRVINLDSFAETVVPLDRQGYRVGIAPNGLEAAVSHSGMVSKVDLQTGTVTDTQMHDADWGDIVMGHQGRAHFVPVRDQWVDFYSVDFAADSVTSTYGARADTQLRMHPVENWVYGANRGLSPSDIEKYDVSNAVPGRPNDSPYHGDYAMSGNIWISEDGARLLVAGGNVFTSAAGDDADMRYDGGLSDDSQVEWADHAEEVNQWAVVPRGANTVQFYSDDFYVLDRTQEAATIPGLGASDEDRIERVFFSEDGQTVVSVLKGASGLSPYALQITD